MEKDKNHGIIIFAITILLFISIIVFVCVKIHLDKKDEKELVDLEDEKQYSDIVIDERAYALMELVSGESYEEGFSNATNKIAYDLEKGTEQNISDFKDEEIAFLMYQYAKNHNYIKKINKKEFYLTEKNAKEIHEFLFGSNLEYKRLENVQMCPSVSYDTSKNRYIYNIDCGMSTNISLYSKIINTRKNKNTFYIEEMIGYYASTLVENNIFLTYKDAINQENSIGTISESTEIQIKSLKNSLARYQFVFKEEGDNHYSFYSVKRIA